MTIGDMCLVAGMALASRKVGGGRGDLDDLIAEAREMQTEGKYISGRIFHALVAEIDRLRAPPVVAASESCCVMAVDPGLGGAVAFYFPDLDLVHVGDMPTADGDVDAAGLAALVDRWSPTVAVVERVASRPGQGVSSVFRFGCGYGMVQGVIAARGVALHLVTPAKWKKHFLLGSDKEASRARALRLWPSRSDLFARKKDHGRAEAALLARYAAEKIIGRRAS